MSIPFALSITTESAGELPTLTPGKLGELFDKEFEPGCWAWIEDHCPDRWFFYVFFDSRDYSDLALVDIWLVLPDPHEVEFRMRFDYDREQVLEHSTRHYESVIGYAGSPTVI